MDDRHSASVEIDAYGRGMWIPIFTVGAPSKKSAVEHAMEAYLKLSEIITTRPLRVVHVMESRSEVERGA